MSMTDWLADWSSWGWPLVLHHLWQASLFSALAFALAFLIRRGPARVRYAIWTLASAKFAIPSVLIGLAANRLAAHTAPATTTPPSHSFPLIAQFAEPL